MSSPESKSRFQVPTTGMRGGLGRTLLTAFLILAIIPLSALSWYATRRERQDIQREVTAKLSSLAAMTEVQVQQWAGDRAADLELLATLPATHENTSALTNPALHSDDDAEQNRDALRALLNALLKQDGAFRRLAVLDSTGKLLVSVDASNTEEQIESEMTSLPLRSSTAGDFQFITLDPDANVGARITQPIAGPEGKMAGLLVGWLNLSGLTAKLEEVNGVGQKGEIYLVDSNASALPLGRTVTSPGIQAAFSNAQSDTGSNPISEEYAGLYNNYAGVPVIGVYRWMPDLELTLVAEQPQAEAFAPADAVTAAIVGATLVVALVTAIIAAVVTRQITRPVVQLTESAVSIAEGDLEQQVPLSNFSRDEIGILAYVFNRMAGELKSLYDDLEAKVAQRTALLQKANYQIQRRAIQLAATVDVSQAVTSVLEPDQLLHEVVRLVHDRFAYSYVGIYLLENEKRFARLHEARGGGEKVEVIKAKPIPIENESAVGTAVLTGQPRIVRWSGKEAWSMFSSPYIRSEAALPLKLGDEIIGVLDILDTKEIGFDADEVSVLQNVANQITIALENARIYEKERETAQRLRETEEFRSRFLAHMSHELREPLTNIIGFSRLILKGLDGAINEQQEKDLHIIYANSQHLLGLINDLLDISQIEAGLMELQFQKLDLAEMIRSVMATASALVRDKDIELHQEIAPNLPLLHADAARIRQVLLRLLSNAAKFTEEGRIIVRAWIQDHSVMVSVSDTGVGIQCQDQCRIFEQFEQGTLENGRRPNGAGLGLALSKKFVEMHGGEIWVESERGKGSIFTFSLPLRPEGEVI
jgi:signal transduction histidine kinase/HAMP domain-containing protein